MHNLLLVTNALAIVAARLLTHICDLGCHAFNVDFCGLELVSAKMNVPSWKGSFGRLNKVTPLAAVSCGQIHRSLIV